MSFTDNLKRLITCQLQDAPVGLSRQGELVARFLNVAQANGCQDCSEDIPRCLTERDGGSQGLAGCGMISLKDGSIPQRPVRARTESQVVGVQILQGSARLGKHRLYLVASERQRRPDSGNLPDK